MVESRRLVAVERVARRRAARPQSLAAAGAVDGDAVRQRPPHGDDLAPRRRRQRRLPRLLLLPRSVGRKSESIATQLLTLVLADACPCRERVLVVIDDSPTKRYGPQVEGADVHHNPTPGPADQPFLYGHVWVTISLALRHPQWGPLALPLRAAAVRPPANAGLDPQVRGGGAGLRPSSNWRPAWWNGSSRS